MDKKLESRLKKLLALAEQGIGGEKENAQRYLEKLLQKHGLSLSDITGETMDTHWFKYKGKLEERLLHQIIYAVVDSDERDFWRNKKKRQTLGVSVTNQEMLEIDIKFNAYKKALNDEIDLLYSAFVNKNDIFPESKECVQEEHEPTLEDKQRSLRMSLIMAGMDKVSVLRELPQKV